MQYFNLLLCAWGTINTSFGRNRSVSVTGFSVGDLWWVETRFHLTMAFGGGIVKIRNLVRGNRKFGGVEGGFQKQNKQKKHVFG